MSFRVVGTGKGVWNDKARFWAKLDDCNTIEYEIQGDPKTKASVKPHKDVTDEVNIGDVVRYDYVASQELNPDGYVTRTQCKNSYLILRTSMDNRYFGALNMLGEFEWIANKKIFVVVKRNVDAKEWVHDCFVYRFRLNDPNNLWLPTEKADMRKHSDAWVEEVKFGKLEESCSWQWNNSLDLIRRLYSQVQHRLANKNSL
jgi:hypothetical protein